MATAGLVLSIIGMILSIIMFIVCVCVAGAATQIASDPEFQSQLSSALEEVSSSLN
ncbi:MAG: hypothetical protein IJG87_10565 [Ruminococcus sp.]|nr:hypothetical protein [Ruminococcus sp.]